MGSKDFGVISFQVISVCMLSLAGTDANVLKDLQSQLFPYSINSPTSTTRPTFYGITQTPYSGNSYLGGNSQIVGHHPYPYGVHQPVTPYSYNYGSRPSFYPSASVLPPNSMFSTFSGNSFRPEQPVTGLPPLPKQTQGTDGKEDAMLLHYSAGDLLKYILSFGISQYLPAQESSTYPNPQQQNQKTQEYLQKISKLKEKENTHGWFWNWRRRRDTDALIIYPSRNNFKSQISPTWTNRQKRFYNPYTLGADFRGEFMALPDHAPYFDPNEQLERQRILSQQIYPTLGPAWKPIGGVPQPPMKPTSTGVNFGWMDPKMPAVGGGSAKSSFGWVDPKLDVGDKTSPPPLDYTLQQMRLMLPKIQ